MNVPYNELELKAALLTLNDSILERSDVQDSIREKVSPSQAEQNVQAAEFHGISVFDLINSPNYTVLVKSYRESRVLDLVQYFEEQGYSNKEAWAVVCILFGAIT